VSRLARLSPGYWLALPAAIWMTIGFVVPVVFLIVTGLFGNGMFGGKAASLATFVDVLGDPYYLGVIGNTLAYATAVTLICLAIAYPFALALIRLPGWAQAVAMIATLLPLTASAIVKTFGITILLRTTGVVNKSLQFLGVIDTPIRMLFTVPGLYFGTANMMLPFMILPIYAALRRIDPALGDAAATLRSGPLDRFLRVTLPLSLPGVFAGFAMVFSLVASAYVMPTLLIGERHKVLSKAIAHSFLVTNETGKGTVLALLLLILCSGMVLLAARVSRTRSAA
jgi:putative spermidine/putrescine transport system permease protein